MSAQKKKTEKIFFSFLYIFFICTSIDNFTLRAICFQKWSTIADSEGSVYMLRQVDNEHFIFLLLLVEKKIE